MKNKPPARIHLLPAKEAPLVVVLRRKPTDWFHVLLWNTETDEVEAGSWYRGMVHVQWSDLSFDGRYLVTYLGYSDTVICRPPWLQPIVQFEELGGYHGGGVFRSLSSLYIDAEAAEVAKMLTRMNDDLPFSVNGRKSWPYPRAASEEVRRPLVEAMDEHSKWNLVSYGSDASEVLEVLTGFEIWYADRHWLINVRIPKPEPRSTGLERVCDLAFAAAARHRGRVALRPLGLGEGWTVEQAVIATYDAGLRYAKANQQTVLMVADNILEQRRFANIIKAYSS